MPESTGRKSQRPELFSQTSFFTPLIRIASSRDTACCIQLWQSSFPTYPMVQGEFACVIPFADSPKGRSCVIEGPCQQCLRPHSDPKRLSNRTFWAFEGHSIKPLRTIFLYTTRRVHILPKLSLVPGFKGLYKPTHTFGILVLYPILYPI